MNWSLEWKLSFNTSKCHVMHLGKNNCKHNYTMGVSHIQPLTNVNTEKDLGVLCDCSMKFQQAPRKVGS